MLPLPRNPIDPTAARAHTLLAYSFLLDMQVQGRVTTLRCADNLLGFYSFGQTHGRSLAAGSVNNEQRERDREREISDWNTCVYAVPATVRVRAAAGNS